MCVCMCVRARVHASIVDGALCTKITHHLAHEPVWLRSRGLVLIQSSEDTQHIRDHRKVNAGLSFTNVSNYLSQNPHEWSRHVSGVRLEGIHNCREDTDCDCSRTSLAVATESLKESTTQLV